MWSETPSRWYWAQQFNIKTFNKIEWACAHIKKCEILIPIYHSAAKSKRFCHSKFHKVWNGTSMKMYVFFKIKVSRKLQQSPHRPSRFGVRRLKHSAASLHLPFTAQSVNGGRETRGSGAHAYCLSSSVTRMRWVLSQLLCPGVLLIKEMFHLGVESGR